MTLPTLELCVHCVGKFYPRLLSYQLTSLIGQDVRVSVVTSDDDKETWKVLDFFSSDLNLVRVILSKREAMRRAIGRNLVAKRTKCDWVWHCDADHLFVLGVGGVRESLAKVPENIKLVYPKIVHRSSQEDGEEMIRKCIPASLSHPQQHVKFEPQPIRFAIGGLQCVRGDYAREHGYLEGTKWMDVPDADEWQETRDDVAFRKSVPGPHLAVDMPGIYRIRHRRAKEWWTHP